MRNLIISIFLSLWCTLVSFAQTDALENRLEAENPNVHFLAYSDTTNVELGNLLKKKTESIIGRIGCGGEDAAYLIIPSIEVDSEERSSGMIRNVSLIKGTLTLKAVSRENQDIIWHSTTVPLEAVVTGTTTEAAMVLANQIKVTDAVYVRFVRVATRKINEASTYNSK